MAIDKYKMIDAVLDSGGNLSEAAAEIGCSIQTIYNYRDKYPDVAEAITHAREEHDCDLLDTAEKKLKEHLEDGAAWAIKYVLSTKGKVRGYTERKEIEHSGAKQIVMQMDIEDTDEE